MKITKQTRNFLYFLGLTLVSLSLILYFTVDGNTLSALKSLRTEFIWVLLFLWFATYSFDSIAIYFMVSAGGERVSLKSAYGTSAFKTFFNMITPVGLGGPPAMIFYLTSRGVPPGKSSSTILTKIMINAAWILLGALAAFAVNYSALSAQKLVLGAFIVTALIQTGFILSVVLIILMPHYFIGFLTRAGNFLGRFRLFKKVDNLRKFLVMEAAAARRSFRMYFRNHAAAFFAASVSNGISYAFSITILYYVLKTLGIDVSLHLSLSFAALLIFIIGFLPTPGGSGLAETLFVLILSGAVPVSVLGIAVIMWRFFLYYITAGIGMVISFKYLSGFSPG